MKNDYLVLTTVLIVMSVFIKLVIADSSEADVKSSLLAEVELLTKRNQELEQKIKELERQLQQCNEKALQSQNVESTFKTIEEENTYMRTSSI